MLQSIKKRTSNKKLFCYSISSPINRSFGALSILRDKKERVKAMGITARLAIIPQEILNIENEKRAKEQSLDLIREPMFLSSVDPAVWMPDPVAWIENYTLAVRNNIHILEMRKRALLSEQQSLIVQAVLRGDRGSWKIEKSSYSSIST